MCRERLPQPHARFSIEPSEPIRRRSSGTAASIPSPDRRATLLARLRDPRVPPVSSPQRRCETVGRRSCHSAYRHRDSRSGLPLSKPRNRRSGATSMCRVGRKAKPRVTPRRRQPRQSRRRSRPCATFGQNTPSPKILRLGPYVCNWVVSGWSDLRRRNRTQSTAQSRVSPHLRSAVCSTRRGASRPTKNR